MGDSTTVGSDTKGAQTFLKNKIPKGGSVNDSENGLPCNGLGTASCPPPLP